MKSLGSSDSSCWVSRAARLFMVTGLTVSRSRPPTDSRTPSSPLRMIPIWKSQSSRSRGLNSLITSKACPHESPQRQSSATSGFPQEICEASCLNRYGGAHGCGRTEFGGVRTPPDLGANHDQQTHGADEQGGCCPTHVDVRACRDRPPG